MKKTLYAVVYEHRFGVDFALVECSRFPTQAEVIKACELEFEEGENITIAPFDIKADIRQIP